MRVAVVGAGVVGMACAHALLDVADEVVVLDAGSVGGGASAGNAGWITPTLATPLASPGIVSTGVRSALDPKGALVIRPSLDPTWLRWLWRFARSSRPEPFRRGVAALLELTNRTLEDLDRIRADGVEFHEGRAGLLAVAHDREGLHWFLPLFDELVSLGFPGAIEHLDGAEARTLEPALGPAVGVGVRMTLDRHVSPESLTHGLAARVRERGGRIREHAPVAGLRRIGGGWALDGHEGELERADLVVLASALGSTALVRPLGLRLPLVGAKGYSVTVPLGPAEPRLPLYLCEPKLGTTPMPDGTRIAGFFELGSRDPAPRAARIRQLVDETRAFLDGGERLEIPERPGWAGFRPSTPDSLPLLGAVPGAPGVILATGHGMLGVTLAPVTGRAVAALARGERPAWLAPFDPARFARA
jgi:D-amino-acid dehydrogenase